MWMATSVLSFRQVPNGETNSCLREESGLRKKNSQSSKLWVVRRKGLLWIKSADFTRHYQKIGGPWLPLRDQTVSQVRLFGENVLTVDHADYKFQCSRNRPPRRTTLHYGQIEVWGLKNLRNL